MGMFVRYVGALGGVLSRVESSQRLMRSGRHAMVEAEEAVQCPVDGKEAKQLQKRHTFGEHS
jgi:hypothetical protein